jgi:hypothetical protein
MSVAGVLTSVQAWPIAGAIRGDTQATQWLFPIIETLHVIALTLVVGSIAMVDLRLLGIGSRESPVTRLTREVLPWTWTAWCLAAMFGSLLFISKATTYWHDLTFRLKFVCMALAAINMLVFHAGAYRRVLDWDIGEPPLGAKLAGALSLLLWIAVVFFGRWTGYTT